MRFFSLDANDQSGGSARVPTGMENDPNADETVINQQVGELYPHPVEEEPTLAGKIAPDDLADSIAYAIDGSGPGPTNDPTDAPGHKVITEGITGAGLDEEEDALRG